MQSLSALPDSSEFTMLRNHLGDGIFFSACLSSLIASSEAMLDSDIFISMAANSLTPYWALFPVGNPIDADPSIPDKVLRILSPILLWCTCPPFC